jgi:hypothetical protein
MKTLTRDAIIGAQDLKLEKIDVAEWGGAIFVRPMDGIERATYEDIVTGLDKKNKSGIRIITEFLVRVIVDQTGKRIFTDKDAAELMKKNARIILEVFKRASEINRLTEKDIEDLEKNL